METNLNVLANKSYNFIGWKSYNLIRKKAMEQEFSWSGFFISMSIAFFIVLITAFGFRLFYNSIATAQKHDYFMSQKVYHLESSKHINNTKFNFRNLFGVKTVNAASNFQGEIIEWNENLELKSEEEKELTLKIKNIGTDIWNHETVFLETGTFLRSFSKVKDSSWIKYYRLSELNKDIRPGEIATINFSIKAPTNINGMIQEYYQLVSGNIIIPGSVIRLFITLESKDIVEDNVQINREATEVLKTEKKVELEKVTVNEEDVDFCIALSDAEKEQYENCRTNENESDTTNGISENIKYENEPILRIGLFNTKKAERVSANTYYDVYGGDRLLLSGLKPGYMSAISFDFKAHKYFVSTPSITKFSDYPIRIVPRNEGIVTLIDFDSRPRWNTNLNDNAFRDVIEFNYSADTKKLWVINELAISKYIKGLAETTNYSPVDYQKAIATAARTYAMYHYNRGIEYNILDGSTKHGAEHYHLDATWDQVYRGYNAELRSSRMSTAVNETKGAVITYDSNVVVTPYFSNSDGRTRSWEEVWYGSAKPWLKSVDVPEDDGKTLWGHGVGMSARGALIMIRDKGVDWIKTLKHFYSGIEVEKVY